MLVLIVGPSSDHFSRDFVGVPRMAVCCMLAPPPPTPETFEQTSEHTPRDAASEPLVLSAQEAPCHATHQGSTGGKWSPPGPRPMLLNMLSLPPTPETARPQRCDRTRPDAPATRTPPPGHPQRRPRCSVHPHAARWIQQCPAGAQNAAGEAVILPPREHLALLNEGLPQQEAGH